MLAGEIQVPALRKSHLATRLFSATVSILNLATALFIDFQQEVLKSWSLVDEELRTISLPTSVTVWVGGSWVCALQTAHHYQDVWGDSENICWA